MRLAQVPDGTSRNQHQDSAPSQSAKTDVQTGSQGSPTQPINNDSEDLAQRIEKLEHLFSASNKGLIDPDQDPPTLNALQDGRASLNKSRMFGRSHWTSTIYAV